MVILKQHIQCRTEVFRMSKVIIQIGLEFVFGPLLKDEEDEKGNESTGSSIVDKDEIAQSLDKKINYSVIEKNFPPTKFNILVDGNNSKKMLDKFTSMGYNIYSLGI